ncbi:MAG: MauE/DoxX family redox-associated membrane protein, partial [Bacteroidota bacterium]
GKVDVQLSAPQVTIQGEHTLDLQQANLHLAKVGEYTISPMKRDPTSNLQGASNPSYQSRESYKPLVLVVSFIIGVTLLVQYRFDHFNVKMWMRHFMAAFFIVFSFFKFLNLEGFSLSYRMYDVIAKRWYAWGYIYPFLELILGVFYLIHWQPFYTNLATAVIMLVSTVGVAESVFSKRKIKCACLGDVFNLPMSLITLIEDLVMFAMALGMLWYGD